MANFNNQIFWATTSDNQYYKLFDTNFNSLNYSGVYIILGRSIVKSPVVIKVGQSENLSERLSQHSVDNDINRYKTAHGPLYVTWAKLPLTYLDGVEKFLGVHYRPLIGDRFPDVRPIHVNVPF